MQMKIESPKLLKPHLTIKEQVNLLRSRGMTIDDPVQAGKFLRHIGYYRFRASETIPQTKTSSCRPLLRRHVARN